MKIMKKIIILSLAAAFIVSGIALSSNYAGAKNNKKAGSIIKGKGLSTLYYLGEDGKRYVFPNQKTYFSWYNDFSGVDELDQGDLQQYPLGGNVRYRPGALLVKIQTDPKVYAVGNNGALHWIMTEALARSLYGANWNKLVDDIPDSFFTNYTIGSEINDDENYDPDEEADDNPTISYNRGFRHMAKRIAKTMTRVEKKCQNLQNAVNRLQTRLARWGMELPDIGDDFMDQCVDNASGVIQNHGVGKATICHKGNTIEVAIPALKAHLGHGDTIGACGDEDENEDEDESESEDVNAPVISNISSDPSAVGAIISWATDEAADSMVEYADEPFNAAGVTINSVSNSLLVSSHSLDLTGLATGTTYYYRVKSADAAGNEASSSQESFVTLDALPDTTAPVLSEISVIASSSSAAITWTTDEPATGAIIYADEPLASAAATSTLVNSALGTSHSFDLTDLATSTQYFYRIESSDSSGNTAEESDSFETLSSDTE